MNDIKTKYLSKLLYWIVNVGLVVGGIGMVTLPWIMPYLFSGSAFYKLVPHYQIMLLLYFTGIPAWLILWKTRQLAKNIIARDPFSKSSLISLKTISICSAVIFLGYLCAVLFLQATFGIIVITMGAFMVALIAAILYKLVQLAMEIKEENDLTI